MFLRILTIEIKERLRSLSTYILILSLFLFYYSQFVGDIQRDGIKPIAPRFEVNLSMAGDEGFRGITSEDFILYARGMLQSDYESGTTLKINGIHMTYEAISEAQREYIASVIQALDHMDVADGNFVALLERVDQTLGGNTAYSNQNSFQQILGYKYYEENLAVYTKILEEDKITNAYGRLYADYLGIAMGFFTVFITAFTLIKDKRYQVNELINTTEVSAFQYVLGKYLADLLVAILPVLLTALHATWMFHGFSMATGDPISYTAFLKYAAQWVMPTVLFVTALSYVLQLIFNNGIVPIILQFFYWKYSVTNLQHEGIQPLKYVIRFNTIMPYSEFQPYLRNIGLNRLLMTVFSLGLLCLGMKLWENKRGDIHHGLHFRKKDPYL